MVKKWIALLVMIVILGGALPMVVLASPATQDQNCAIDLMLVLDSSGSISPEDYELMRGWVRDLVDRFTLGTDNASVGIVQFSAGANYEVRLTSQSIRINDAIDNMRQIGADTNITAGLQLAQQELQASQRDSAPRVIVVLSDGEHNYGNDPVSYAQDIRSGETTGGSTTILGVAVGSFNIFTLTEIAGGDFNVIQVPDFAGLQQILSILHDYSCAVATEGTVNASSLPQVEAPAIQPTTAPLVAQPTTAPSTGNTTVQAQPTVAPTATQQATPAPASPPLVATGDCTIHSIIDEKVNMRIGPGLGQVWMGFLPRGVEHPVVAQAKDVENVTWWQLETGYWVRHDLVGESGDCASVATNS